jgi:hypothetical protein
MRAQWFWAAAFIVNLATPALADPVAVKSAINDEAFAYTFTASRPLKQGDGVGPAEATFARHADGSEALVEAGDLVLQSLTPGASYRTPSGSALNVKQCDGFKVTLVGDGTERICRILSAYSPAEDIDRLVKIIPIEHSFDMGGVFYQAGRDWVHVAFSQKFTTASGVAIDLIKEDSFKDDIPDESHMTMRFPVLAPLLSAEHGRVEQVGAGAVAEYSSDRRTLLPPGLTLITAAGLCTRLAPVVAPEDFIMLTAKIHPPPTADQIAVSFKQFGCTHTKHSPSYIGRFIFFGIPLAVIGVIVWLILRRRSRRYKGALPGGDL